MRKIAESLIAPHAAGLCHGNLSPETLHLDEESPFLADFSLGQLLRLDYHSGIDPQYTSPEQVRGETPGPAADLYNLGCVFFRLLTGEAPFTGSDPFAIAKQHLLGDFPQLPDSLTLLQPLLGSLLLTNPGERPSADELISALTTVLDDPAVDQLELSIALDSPPEASAPPSAEDPSTRQDQEESSDIAARVEERLKGHSGDFQVEAPVDLPLDAADVFSSESEPPARQKKGGLVRGLIVLLLGIGIGYGAFCFVTAPAPQPVPSVVKQVPPVATKPVAQNLDEGLQLWQKNDLVGAEEALKKTLETFNDDPRGYNNLAAFYAAQGNYEQARDYLERALNTSKEYATVYRNLASVYAEMARGSYGRALQLNKNQHFISLPVFSSQGIITLGAPAGQEIAEQKPRKAKLEPAAEPVVEPRVGALTAAATKEAEGEKNISQSEQVKVVAENDVRAKVETETPVVAAPARAPAPPEAEAGQSGAAEEPELESPDDFLQRWAQAWSAQNVDRYLSFYAAQFIPPGGRTRQQWESQRHQRLTAPKKIVVSLDEIKVIPQADEKVRIEAVQSYQSNVMSDKTRKIFDLVREQDSWKIVRERSLGAVR